MGSRLFVGNLPYDATEEELTGHFSQVGPVSRVFLPLDRDTGRPRGFAFVEFPSSEHAAEAIQRLHQQPFKERPLVVNEARPSEARPTGGGTRTGSRPPAGGGGFRPESRERTTVGGGAPSRPPAKSKTGGGGRRRRGKRSFWDEGPKKEPLKEKLGGRFYGVEDEPSEDDEIDFENFATGEGDSDDE